MKLAIILIHGIGPIKEEWAEDIIEELKKKTASQITKLLTDTKTPDIDDIIEIRSVYWKGVFQKREDALNEILDRQIETMKIDGSFVSRIARAVHHKIYEFQNEITTNFIGDIIVYGNPTAQQDVYSKISQTLDDVAKKIEGLNSKAPLTIIAHSLGTVIASDFIYDLRKERQKIGEDSFDSRFCLYNLFTVGSPIALFSLRFGDPAAFNKPIYVEDEKGRWLNIYDTDDPVGMPLRPLNNAYADAVFKDVKVDAGIYGLSHTSYFSHSKTIDMISCKLAIDWVALNKKLSQETIDKLYCQYDETLCVI
jgi:hypothetical protein